jgi:hypothetical protein
MTIGTLGVFVRIFLYGVTAIFLREAWVDDATVELIRHPETVAIITGAIAAAWYALAKWRGWKT